jgi:hypothetical protein
MKRATLAMVLLIGSLPAPAAAMCYTVYDAQNRIIYRAPYTPVDLSQSVTSAMKAKFAGAQLVISDDDTRCTLIEPSAPFDPFTGAAAERLPGYDAKK